MKQNKLIWPTSNPNLHGDRDRKSPTPKKASPNKFAKYMNQNQHAWNKAIQRAKKLNPFGHKSTAPA